jgi:hypothetical protein
MSARRDDRGPMRPSGVSHLAVALLLVVAACDRRPGNAGADSVRVSAPVAIQQPDSLAPVDSTTVVVQGPVLVAFYPALSQAAVDSSEDLATVFDDFSYHLSTAMDSLRALGITVTERPVGRIRLSEGGREREFLPAKDSAAVGYLFVSPGEPDRVQYGVMTNSDLVDAARHYLESHGRVPVSLH